MARLSFLLLAATLPLTAHADRLPLPANAPPAFQAECGSCHLAFPPALLSSADWRKVMAGLDKHYGDNAALDDDTRRVIEGFLTAHAASDRRKAGRGDPPRLTRTVWFERKHREVPAAAWRDPRTSSAANCAACHTKAEAGSYREREINVPGIGRWED